MDERAQQVLPVPRVLCSCCAWPPPRPGTRSILDPALPLRLTLWLRSVH